MLTQANVATQGIPAWVASFYSGAVKVISWANGNEGAILAAALLVAIWSIYAHKGVARRDATLSFIENQEADADLLDANQKFVELTADSNLVEFAKKDKQSTDEAQAIKTLLNQYELASIGIQNNIIDYEMYKRWCRGRIIGVYDKSSQFIKAIRDDSGNEKLYCEFEYMYECMKNNKRMRRLGVIRRTWRVVRRRWG